jgi:hypothetical protein
MFPFSDMVNLFSNEFPSLSRGSLAFPGVLLCTFNRLFFRHLDLLKVRLTASLVPVPKATNREKGVKAAGSQANNLGVPAAPASEQMA